MTTIGLAVKYIIFKDDFNELLYKYRIEDVLIGQYKYNAQGENLQCRRKSSDGIVLTATLIRSNDFYND